MKNLAYNNFRSIELHEGIFEPKLLRELFEASWKI
jgi:hypothetical protein